MLVEYVVFVSYEVSNLLHFTDYRKSGSRLVGFLEWKFLKNAQPFVEAQSLNNKIVKFAEAIPWREIHANGYSDECVEEGTVFEYA